MDGGDGGGLRSAHSAAPARKGSFPPGYTAAGCSSPRCTEGGGDRRQSSLSSSVLFPSPSRLLISSASTWGALSTHLSFDPSGDGSVLNDVRDTVHVSVERVVRVIRTKAIAQTLNINPVC